MIAAIRVKGEIHTSYSFRETMKFLRLERVNHLVLLDPTPQIQGMLKSVEFLLTWGDIDEPTLALLLEKRGRVIGNRKLSESVLKAAKAKDFVDLAAKILKNPALLAELKIKPVFRLHPPKKGFGRQGIKKSFSVGGASGNRREAINALVRAMS